MDALEIAVTALATIAATLLGVAVGHRLSTERSDQLLRREAAEQVVATTLEVETIFQGIDVELAGGPPAPELRADFAKDALLPVARLGIIGKPEGRAAASTIGDCIQEAIKVCLTPGSTRDTRKAAEDRVEAALHEFREIAAKDI